MSTGSKQVDLQRALYTSRNPTRRYLHQSRKHWVESAIGGASHGGTILEVGPGSGVYFATLAAQADVLIALDREAIFLNALRAQPEFKSGAVLCALVQGDIAAPPLPLGSVDTLVCSEVIEHLHEFPKALRAMAGLLAPGGRLILTTPQPFSVVELLGKIAFLPGIVHILRWLYREPIEDMGHINLVSRRRLLQQFAAADLSVLNTEVLGLYLPGIAEFGGQFGQRFLSWLEPLVRASPLRGMLWTQCYVLAAQNPASSSAP